MARKSRVTWRVAVVGKPKLPFAAAGVAEYLGRIKHYAQIEFRAIRASGPAQEARELLRASEQFFRIVLDERGRQLASRDLASRLAEWDLQEQRSIALLVGGADGLTDEVRSGADFRWSLGKGTLPHELALLIALEQIYRGYTILQGFPYHREA